MAAKGKRLGALCLAFLAATVAVGAAVVVQTEGVRVSVLSQVMPYKLPRVEPAPIAIFVGGHLEAVDGGIPPQLERLRIQVNRHGLLQSRGLPVCRPRQVQPATTERAAGALDTHYRHVRPPRRAAESTVRSEP